MYRSCIAVHKALIFDRSLQYVQCVPYARIKLFYCLALFDTDEFNRLPCPSDRKYDDVVSIHRFLYQLPMFGIRVVIGLPRLIHAHIAYETDTAKIIAAFCRISYCLHDLMR